MQISVIMPLYNASHFLPLVLPPLLGMKDRGEVLEVIVVDDLSTDTSAAIAADLGARVITSTSRAGPGAARNIGSHEAAGDILWFIDSDVIAHEDAARKMLTAFEGTGATAAFGSYDDEPAASNFMSQYKNMIHHYYHQKAKRQASTFWSGCGAVLKERFLAVGGFDIVRYPRPAIEDIELGYRLRAAGGDILLVHDLLAKHLKHWTLPGAIHTDIFSRAIPWSRLLVAQNGITDDLNVSKGERARAALAGLLFASTLLVLLGWSYLWAPVGLLAIAFAANWDLFTFFLRRKELSFAIRALLFHQLYYVYSSAAYVWCWFEAKLFTKQEKRLDKQ